MAMFLWRVRGDMAFQDMRLVWGHLETYEMFWRIGDSATGETW